MKLEGNLCFARPFIKPMPRFSHDMCFVILINSTQNFHSLWAQVYFSPEGRGAGIGYVTLQCIGYVTLQFTWSPHRALQYFHDSSLSLHSPLSILHSPPLHSYSPCFSWIRVTFPPRPKKNRLQVTNDYFLRYPQLLISNVPHLLIQLIQPRPSSLP